MAGILGALAVAFGAFGAHGLRGWLETLPDGAKRLEWWETAAHYHLAHALALGLVGALATKVEHRALAVARGGFVIGIVLFSGSLYVMTSTGTRWLGAVTPFGGTAMIVGWIALAFAARSR